MVRIDTIRRQAQRVAKGWQPELGEMNRLVWVCTTIERPDMNVSTIVKRPGVIKVHARVRPLRSQTILDYVAVFGEANKPSTEITIRCPPDVKIDLNHWVYVETKYTKTWYKVRNVEDMGGRERFLLMHCSIEEINDSRTDPATQKAPPRWEDPNVTRVPDSI